jgi:hypothetical protein
MGQRLIRRSGFPTALLWASAACVLLLPRPLQAGSLGAAPAVPLQQALARTEAAAEAVLARQGRPSCLIGKLTNALLELASSCEAAAERGELCRLADRAVSTTGWTLAFADATARQLLGLRGLAANPRSSTAAAEAEAPTP